MGRASKTMGVIQKHVTHIIKSLDTTDYYRLLDVPLNTTSEQVTESFCSIVEAYRIVLQHKECPKKLRNDISIVCQRLAEAQQVLCNKENRCAYDAAFSPVARRPDAPPFHPVRMKPGKLRRSPGPRSNIIPGPEPALETMPGATREVTTKHVRPRSLNPDIDPTTPGFDAARALEDDEEPTSHDTDVDPTLQFHDDAFETVPIPDMPADDDGGDDLATVVDPRLPLVDLDEVATTATVLENPDDDAKTAVDPPLRLIEEDLAENPEDVTIPVKKAPLVAVFTAEEEPTRQEKPSDALRGRTRKGRPEHDPKHRK